ncbi:hypothetical protein ACFV1N_42080 [Streptosporangium canum]|uniref:hypothetical protein n=1 Tax=Streptosporangium canum TaxID=324952 RepID=UPI003677B20F
MLDPTTRERLEDKVRAYNAQVNDIRNNPHLSERGKREQIKDLYDTHKAAVDTMRAQADKTQQTTAADLERRLFGMTAGNDPSAVISFRDAVDRVASIKSPSELGELMERAHRTGDTGLLRAGFGHAWRKSRDPLGSDDWSALVSEYVEHNPDAGDDLTRLQQMTSSRGKTAELVERMATSLPRPKELDARNQPSDELPEDNRPENLTR